MAVAKITPQQMLAQISRAPYNLEVGLHNFEVRVGQSAEEIFKESFDSKSFDGKSWPTYDYRGKKQPPPHSQLLTDTLVLKNSIKVKPAQGHKVVIFTDPNDFNNSSRHPGFCYAGVHNNYDSLTNPPDGPRHQRQFIGHHSKLDARIHQLSNELLRNIII